MKSLFITFPTLFEYYARIDGICFRSAEQRRLQGWIDHTSYGSGSVLHFGVAPIADAEGWKHGTSRYGINK